MTNYDLAFDGTLSDGRNVTWVVDLTTFSASAFFFTEHSFNSGNTTLTWCSQQMGMTVSGDAFNIWNVDVGAWDLYFTGNYTDWIFDIEMGPFGERYIGLIDTIAPHSSGVLGVYDFGPAGTNPSESGLLLITTAEDATGISGAKTEAIPVRVRTRSGGGHGAK